MIGCHSPSGVCTCQCVPGSSTPLGCDETGYGRPLNQTMCMVGSVVIPLPQLRYLAPVRVTVARSSIMRRWARPCSWLGARNGLGERIAARGFGSRSTGPACPTGNSPEATHMTDPVTRSAMAIVWWRAKGVLPHGLDVPKPAARVAAHGFRRARKPVQDDGSLGCREGASLNTARPAEEHPAIFETGQSCFAEVGVEMVRHVERQHLASAHAAPRTVATKQ